MKKGRARPLAGFTIIELLLYMGLFSILITIIGGLFFSILQLRLEAETVSSVQQDSNFIIGRLKYDLNGATGVTSPASPGQTATVLTFVKSATTYTYTLSGTDLLLAVSGQPPVSLNGYNTQVLAFNVTRLGNPGGFPYLNISFTLSGKSVFINQQPETKIFTTGISLR